MDGGRGCGSGFSLIAEDAEAETAKRTVVETGTWEGCWRFSAGLMIALSGPIDHHDGCEDAKEAWRGCDV